MGSGSFGLSYLGGETSGGVSSPLSIFDANTISNRFSQSMNSMGIVDYSLQVVDFKLEYYVPSFPQAEFPDFKDYDSEAVKASKRLKSANTGGYFDIELLIKDSAMSPWRGISVVRCQNYGFIWEEGLLNPRMSSSDRFSLGAQSQIGVKFIDRGWGVPKAGDWVNFSGSWVDDFKLYPFSYIPASSVIHNTGTVAAAATSPVTLFLADENRRAFTIQIESGPGLYIYFGSVSLTPSGKQYIKDYGLRIDSSRELSFQSLDYTLPQACSAVSMADSASGLVTDYRIVQLLVG